MSFILLMQYYTLQNALSIPNISVSNIMIINNGEYEETSKDAVSD